MSVEIAPETEARLTDEAQRLGISVDTLLARLVSEHAGLAQTRPKLELPPCLPATVAQYHINRSR